MKPGEGFSVRHLLITLAQKIMVTGNTLRRVVQMPLVQQLLGSDSGVALDLGAGGGKYSCGMYTFGCLRHCSSQVIALDPEDLFCRLIASKSRSRSFFNIHAICARGEWLPIRDASVDTVLCTEVLTYMADDQKGAREIARILKPQGQAIISVPLPPEPAPVNGALREGYEPGQLEALLARAGLKIVEHRSCMYGLSRLLLGAEGRCWSWTRGRLHLPLLFVAYLERRLDERGIRWGEPYCLIVRAIKA